MNGSWRNQGAVFNDGDTFMSQKQFVLNALLKGKSISPIKALAEYGIFRLADVIYKLKLDGWDITTTIKSSLVGKRYAEYTMEVSK
jgi:hypothetical protein